MVLAVSAAPSTADFRFPAKNVKFLRVLRYDRPESRNPGSWATRAHNFDHTIVRYLGFSGMCLLFQPRSDTYDREPAILVTTIGGRTGLMREAVLTAFTEDDGAWIVVATNGGLKQQPGWVFNLRRNPICWVRHRRQDYPAIAEELSGEDEKRVFEWLTPRYPVLVPYAAKVAANNRTLSMWRLRRRAPGQTYAAVAET